MGASALLVGHADQGASLWEGGWRGLVFGYLNQLVASAVLPVRCSTQGLGEKMDRWQLVFWLLGRRGVWVGRGVLCCFRARGLALLLLCLTPRSFSVSTFPSLGSRPGRRMASCESLLPMYSLHFLSDTPDTSNC